MVVVVDYYAFLGSGHIEKVNKAPLGGPTEEAESSVFVKVDDERVFLPRLVDVLLPCWDAVIAGVEFEVARDNQALRDAPIHPDVQPRPAGDWAAARSAKLSFGGFRAILSLDGVFDAGVQSKILQGPGCFKAIGDITTPFLDPVDPDNQFLIQTANDPNPSSFAIPIYFRIGRTTVGSAKFRHGCLVGVFGLDLMLDAGV